jgi:hypothetical protein
MLLKSLRNDEASGNITCNFGIVLIKFTLFVFLIVGVQRLFFLLPNGPAANGPPDIAFKNAIDAIHRVFIMYFPWIMLMGIIFAVAGFYVRKGSLVARRVAQFTALCSYVWIIDYTISCHEIMDVLGAPVPVIPPWAMTIFQWLSLVAGTLIGAAFPTGLLYVLSRPQDPLALSHCDGKSAQCSHHAPHDE